MDKKLRDFKKKIDSLSIKTDFEFDEIDFSKNFPYEVYIIFDTFGIHHVFRSKKEAWKAYRKRKKNAEINKDSDDSFWKMSEPKRFRYLTEKFD